MTTATSGAGTAAPPATIKWRESQARIVILSQCGRWAVRETIDGKIFTAIDFHALTVSSTLFATAAEARAWCEARAAEHPSPRGAGVDGEEWPAEELPRW